MAVFGCGSFLCNKGSAAARTDGKGILVSDHLYRDVCDISDSLYLIAGCSTRLVNSPDDLRQYGYIK